MPDNEKNNVTSTNTGAAKSDAKVEPKKVAKEKTPFKERAAKMWREYKSEMKKIVWYNREQTFKSSIIVIASILVVSACVGGFDWVFSKLLMWLGSLV